MLQQQDTTGSAAESTGRAIEYAPMRDDQLIARLHRVEERIVELRSAIRPYEREVQALLCELNARIASRFGDPP